MPVEPGATGSAFPTCCPKYKRLAREQQELLLSPRVVLKAAFHAEGDISTARSSRSHLTSVRWESVGGSTSG